MKTWQRPGRNAHIVRAGPSSVKGTTLERRSLCQPPAALTAGARPQARPGRRAANHHTSFSYHLRLSTLSLFKEVIC